MRYEVFSREHGRRVAHGDGVIVWYDYAEAKTVALPDDLRQRLDGYRWPTASAPT